MNRHRKGLNHPYFRLLIFSPALILPSQAHTKIYPHFLRYTTPQHLTSPEDLSVPLSPPRPSTSFPLSPPRPSPSSPSARVHKKGPSLVRSVTPPLDTVPRPSTQCRPVRGGGPRTTTRRAVLVPGTTALLAQGPVQIEVVPVSVDITVPDGSARTGVAPRESPTSGPRPGRLADT